MNCFVIRRKVNGRFVRLPFSAYVFKRFEAERYSGRARSEERSMTAREIDYFAETIKEMESDTLDDFYVRTYATESIARVQLRRFDNEWPSEYEIVEIKCNREII